MPDNAPTPEESVRWQVVIDRDAPPGDILGALADLLIHLLERDNHSARLNDTNGDLK